MILAASFTLLRPTWLLVLLAAPLFVWLALRASKGRPRAGDFAALAARTLLLAAIALALSVPRFEKASEGRSVAYVLDVSESIPPEALRRAGEFVRESSSMRGEKDDAAFVVFADGAAVEAPFARVSATRRMEAVVIDPANLASKLPRGESDAAGALRIARAGFPPGGARRIVLVTDGNETRGDAAAAVKELLADRVEVSVVPVRYEREREVLVSKLVAPAFAGTVTPSPVRVVVESTHDSVPAKIRFLVDEKEVVGQDAVLNRGPNFFEMSHTFATSGIHRIEAIVEPAADGNPANNRGRAAVFVEGRGRVLLASNVPKSPLAAALRENLDAEVDAGGPDLIPSDPGDLVPYDAVVLEDVPAFALSELQRRILASAVRDFGLGLVCIGGPHTFGPGGYAGTDLEAVLPVSSEISQKRVLPAGALVIVLHTCEFPDGNRAARAITKAAISALSEKDEIGVLDYDMNGGDKWVIELQRCTDKEALRAKVDAASPADMPSFDSIVRMAWEGLKSSTAAVKHLIIISDGDPALPDDKLSDSLVADKISISTVLVNPHQSGGAQAAMARLAETHGGRFYFVDASSLDSLPQIFLKEAVTVRRSAVSEEPFKPAMRGLHRMLRDVSEDDLPALRGYVITTAKPNVEEVLVGPEADPLLATWRCGLGQAVAWTSDASLWARDWAAWNGYGRFFGQIVKSSLRALNRSGANARAEVSGGTAHVLLDVLRPDGSFANGLEVSGSVVLPDGGSKPLRMEQTGPGRYEGSFPAKHVGTTIATLLYRDPAVPGDEGALATAAVCVPYSAEHLAQRSNERFFAVLESAGATLLDVEKLDDALARDPNAVNPRSIPWQGEAKGNVEAVELWPWIAAAAALLLVVDVAVRRVRVPWDRILAMRKNPQEARSAMRPLARGPAIRAPAGKFDPESAGPATREAAVPQNAQPPDGKTGAQSAGQQDGLLGAKRRAKRKQTWEENQ